MGLGTVVASTGSLGLERRAKPVQDLNTFVSENYG